MDLFSDGTSQTFDDSLHSEFEKGSRDVGLRLSVGKELAARRQC